MSLSPRRGCPNRCGRNPFAHALPRGGSNRTAKFGVCLIPRLRREFLSVRHQGPVRRPKRGRDGKNARVPVRQLATKPGPGRKQYTHDDVQPPHRCEHSLLPPTLNQVKALPDWLGVRVYEPEREEWGNVVWHPRRNSPAKLKNILTIDAFDGHAFLIKDIDKLARTYVCVHCRARFTHAGSGIARLVPKERRESSARTKKSKPQKQLSSKSSFLTKPSASGPPAGLKGKRSAGKSISTTPGAGMEVKGGLRSNLWTGFTPPAKLFLVAQLPFPRLP